MVRSSVLPAASPLLFSKADHARAFGPQALTTLASDLLSSDNSKRGVPKMLAAAFQNAITPANSLTGSMSWAEACLISTAAVVVAMPVTAALYLVKSALGINLMDGPSPLHDLLFQFVS